MSRPLAGGVVALLCRAGMALGATAAMARADAGDTIAQAEIGHLLAYLGDSDCEFYRNGSWYGPRRAEAHLRRKLDYYLDHARSPSAEDFIAQAASASSMSGEAYQVRCPAAAPQPAAAWFGAELSRYRAANIAR